MRCTVGERVLIEREAAIVTRVDQFVRGGRRFHQDAEPAERVDALVILAQRFRHRATRHALGTVAADDEIALQFVIAGLRDDI